MEGQPKQTLLVINCSNTVPYVQESVAIGYILFVFKSPNNALLLDYKELFSEVLHIHRPIKEKVWKCVFESDLGLAPGRDCGNKYPSENEDARPLHN